MGLYRSALWSRLVPEPLAGEHCCSQDVESYR